MGTIDIEDVPPELHERLRVRARREGMSLDAYVTRILERDLARPDTTSDWLERFRQTPPTSSVQVETPMD
jgi:plasmid stability protein